VTDADGRPQGADRIDPEAARTPDLGPTLDDLEQATRSFNMRFGGAQQADSSRLDADRLYDERIRHAEREAAAYLADAKRRADNLVNAMAAAVEREAAAMQRDAEEGIRARWQAVEADAARHVEEARDVAERLVAERQRRIAALSDGITARAEALTAGLADAERVRAQFESFVRALSRAADQVAGESATTAGHPIGGPGGGEDQTRPIAA